MEHLSCEESLRGLKELGLVSLEERFQGGRIAAFQYLNGAYEKDEDKQVISMRS